MHFLITAQPRCALSLRDTSLRREHGPCMIRVPCSLHVMNEVSRSFSDLTTCMMESAVGELRRAYLASRSNTLWGTCPAWCSHNFLSGKSGPRNTMHFLITVQTRCALSLRDSCNCMRYKLSCGTRVASRQSGQSDNAFSSAGLISLSEKAFILVIVNLRMELEALSLKQHFSTANWHFAQEPRGHRHQIPFSFGE